MLGKVFTIQFFVLAGLCGCACVLSDGHSYFCSLDDQFSLRNDEPRVGKRGEG